MRCIEEQAFELEKIKHRDACLLEMQHASFITLLFTNQINTNAEITKESFGFITDSFKSIGQHVKFLKTALPLLSWLFTVTGFALKMLAICLDKNMPLGIKLTALFFLALLIAGSTAMLILATSNPLVALAIGVGMIAIGVGLELGNCFFHGLKWLACRKKAAESELTPKESQQIARFKNETLHLEKKLDDLLHTFLVVQEGKSQKAGVHLKDIKQLQDDLCQKKQCIAHLTRKSHYARQNLIKQKKKLANTLLGLGLCIATSLTTALGIVLAASSPFIGIPIILLALSFDFIGFCRQVHAKSLDYREQKKTNNLQLIEKNHQLINSISRINKQQEERTQSYSTVLLNLKERRPTIKHASQPIQNRTPQSYPLKDTTPKLLPQIMPDNFATHLKPK